MSVAGTRLATAGWLETGSTRNTVELGRLDGDEAVREAPRCERRIWKTPREFSNTVVGVDEHSERVELRASISE